MAGLERLVSTIYHEKQQPGSMLCAQHALNSLLQGNYFSAPDLSDIARNLDSIEESYNHSRRRSASMNMDDTGFFSVQVVHRALSVWGLDLIRWRSEEMRPYNDRPHTQIAFILNFEQHWFTLRRFGHITSDFRSDSGDGHWFNLNSHLQEPVWVSKLYLGMVLQQAETEGYSVFAVTQENLEVPSSLPLTEADELASVLPEATSAAIIDYDSMTSRNSNPSTTENPSTQDNNATSLQAGFEDEDYELQAALQASLTNVSCDLIPTAPTPAPLPLPESRTSSSSSSASVSRAHLAPSRSSPLIPTPNSLGLNFSGVDRADADADPLATSMERNRLLLQQMLEEQELAQRELMETVETPPMRTRRAQRHREEEAEQEELRRAIEESEAMTPDNVQPLSEKQNMDTENDEYTMREPTEHSGATTHRVLYDDDAELQAALRASLETVPVGFQLPELSQTSAPPHSASASAPAPTPAWTSIHSASSLAPSSSTVSSLLGLGTGDSVHSGASDEDREDDDEGISLPIPQQDAHAAPRSNMFSLGGGAIAETGSPRQVEELSMEEIRRRRLARFGQ